MFSSFFGGGGSKAAGLQPDLEAGRQGGGGALANLGSEDVFKLPLDNAIEPLYETADRLKARLEGRDFARSEHVEHVRLADVEGEMNELTMDKDNDESIDALTKKSLESLTKKTVTRTNKDAKLPLDAARICQIENRLKNDPSLQIEKRSDGTLLWEFPENPAAHVKRNLIKTYQSIKRSGHDMSQVTLHQLEERVEMLKKL
ncbi:hypothetical protein AK812_SmicGene23761 [Symbiodinium microadriaticum]|uniref:Uncharacterized protein n=1 Tax=Symbiodinium microadriaticum TaxID=2951 RepID=A0A1Q9DGG4_SYMMI|nr:hypothetical protein AK812_SmicGene23761 [Symbiodinium microadriaticum]|mmetsp:Transcript_93332/g.221932  ORF Transcript_93332/g.221932 Transcript_93332/m.221932 type:complete len:202 (+) Transcript_93332:53-658(+)|eukprot:CAMPEP_0181441782 /NCGR_PEP_ID=MMETSP1110-20121109/23686_1 /TAXON_ID=174948 /ORGANISM="Symbiodinium sp., Strain CCMP421" /LENGTH=201 /DNA_ID=CAMNT_0023565679 /DNA_START=46 /DNA_END=651 /DNA_ORIENTATION=+